MFDHSGTLFIEGFTAQKTVFSFSKCSEKMVFSKKVPWNMIFLVSSGKIIFLFNENMILFFRQKMWSFSKKYMEIWYFLQMFWKDGLSKKIALEYDLSCIIRKNGISFSRKNDIFSIHENWKKIFFKKYMKIWYCLYIL